MSIDNITRKRKDGDEEPEYYWETDPDEEYVEDDQIPDGPPDEPPAKKKPGRPKGKGASVLSRDAPPDTGTKKIQAKKEKIKKEVTAPKLDWVTLSTQAKELPYYQEYGKTRDLMEDIIEEIRKVVAFISFVGLIIGGVERKNFRRRFLDNPNYHLHIFFDLLFKGTRAEIIRKINTEIGHIIIRYNLYAHFGDWRNKKAEIQYPKKEDINPLIIPLSVEYGEVYQKMMDNPPMAKADKEHFQEGGITVGNIPQERRVAAKIIVNFSRETGRYFDQRDAKLVKFDNSEDRMNMDQFIVEILKEGVYMEAAAHIQNAFRYHWNCCNEVLAKIMCVICSSSRTSKYSYDDVCKIIDK